MARTTARKLASSTVAAARRVTRTSAARPPADTAPKAATKSKAGTAKAPATKKAAAAKKAPVSKKAPATKAPATKAAAKKATTTKKAPATKAAAKKAPAKKAPAKKAPAKKAPAKKAPATKAPATKAPATKAPASRGAAGRLAVKADEKPWTKAELDEVRAELNTDRDRLRSELNLAEHELHDLRRDAGDGAGNDQADVGSATFERDHEMSLANNAREMLAQTERALARIENGSYGVCESCGEPIGKMRLMAFPRATLCLTCKQREERR